MSRSNPTSRDWRAGLPFFYGWLILAGSLLVLGLTYSVMYSFSVFYVALLEEFGWGRGEAAGVYSVFMIVTGVGALGAGALSDRFGPGRVIACGGTFLAAGLLICSKVTELWQFYVSFGVLVALGVSLAGWTPCVTMVNRWFSVRLGFALGIASAGIGVGIMVVVPLVQVLISGLGWRSAFVALAGIVFLGLLALTRVVPFTGMLYLYALVFAIGYAVSAPLWPVVTSDLFAGRHFGSVYGLITLFSGFGNALGAWLGGYVYDLTGSYAIAFGVAVAGKAASAGALWIVAPRKVRRVRRYPLR